MFKSMWKIYKYAAIAIFTVVVIDAIVVVGVSLYRPEIKKADAVVVLGAAINTPALYNRSLEGLRLYYQHKADVLVLSGGKISEQDISEAQYMQKVISANAEGSLPNMILEENSHSTYENLKNTKSKIGHGKSIVVVSDSFHLARAAIMARRMGFHPVYWSSPKPSYYKPRELTMYYLREMVAMIAYVPKFVFN